MEIALGARADTRNSGRGQMAVMQDRQGGRQGRDIGAVERRDTKKDHDLVTPRICSKPLPQLEHGQATAVIGVQTGPPQLQQGPARSQQRVQIIFRSAVKAACRPRLIVPHQAINADNLLIVGTCGIAQQQMIRVRVKPIGLASGLMVDKRAVAAKFLYKNRITQPLGRAQIVWGFGQPDREGGGGRDHGARTRKDCAAFLGRPTLPRNVRDCRKMVDTILTNVTLGISRNGCTHYGANTRTRSTLRPSITTLPTSGNITVIVVPMLDCTCPVAPFGTVGVAHDHPRFQQRIHLRHVGTLLWNEDFMTISPDLNALLGSRICHDLISPLGAIGNGVELLQMSGVGDSAELSLITESVANANARIRLFRVAFGAAAPEQKMARSEIVATLEPIAASRRITLSWRPTDDIDRAIARLTFLLFLCCETALPRGGVLTVHPKP